MDTQSNQFSFGIKTSYMKYTILNALVGVVFSIQQVYAIKCVKIEDAIQQNLIQSTISHQAGSFYNKIQFEVQSLCNEIVVLRVDAGTHLVNEEERAQNHLITRQDTMVLVPLVRRTKMFTGMCCEPTDHGPRIGSRYTITSNPIPYSVELCHLIDSLNAFEYDGQCAIWSLVRHDGRSSVYGRDSQRVMALRMFLHRTIGNPVTPFQRNDYVRQIPARMRPTEHYLNEQGEWWIRNISYADKITLELVDWNTDRLIRSIQHERIYIQRGTLDLHLSAINLGFLANNTSYIVRIKKNGVILNEWMYEMV